jgi:hypothetical protein
LFNARGLLSLLVIPLLALVIACSSGDDDDDTPAPATGGGSTAGQSTGGDGGSTGGQSTGSGGGSATGGGSTGSTGSTDSGSTGSASSDDLDPEDCPELQAFVDSAGVGDAFTGAGAPGQDFDAEDFQQLADNAPGEIKDDMQVLADVLQEFFAALEDLEVDFSNPASFANLSAEDLAELEELSTRFDTPEIQAASERIEAYFNELCS